jgi:hypothetical protein
MKTAGRQHEVIEREDLTRARSRAPRLVSSGGRGVLMCCDAAGQPSRPQRASV